MKNAQDQEKQSCCWQPQPQEEEQGGQVSSFGFFEGEPNLYKRSTQSNWRYLSPCVGQATPGKMARKSRRCELHPEDSVSEEGAEEGCVPCPQGVLQEKL